MTWAGERMVEVPIVKSLLEAASGKRILEVGNVLGHYFPISHDVVDKYEQGTRVQNVDILQFRADKPFDLVVSISTFEHIGFDDDAVGSSGEKIMQAVRHCRNLLAADGRLVITVPTGYNPDLDDLLATGNLGAERLDCLKRVGKRAWQPCSLAEAMKHRYRLRYPYANAVVVCEFRC